MARSLCQLYLHLIFGCPAAVGPPLQGCVLLGGRSLWALSRACPERREGAVFARPFGPINVQTRGHGFSLGFSKASAVL
jgi:hypothetical protein